MKLSMRRLHLLAVSILLAHGPAIAVATHAAPQEPPPSDQDQGQRFLQLARQHAEAGRWQDAADAYATALRFLPGNAEALAGLDQARTMLNQGSTIQSTQEEIERLRQQTRVEFEEAMIRAQTLLDEGDHASAEREVLAAEVKLNLNRSLLPPSEFEAKRNRANEMSEQIDIAREQQLLLEQTRIQEEKERELREREIAAQVERQRMINANLERVRQLQMELKYSEALQVIDQILFLDPINPAALALRDMMRRNLLLGEYVEIQRQKEAGIGAMWVGGQAALVAPGKNLTGPGPRAITDVMTYPEDWPHVTYLRTGESGFTRSPADYRVERSLSERAVQVNFQNHSLAQVMDYFGSVTGVNLYVDWKALEFIGVGRNDPVNLQLGQAEVPAQVAIERVLEQMGSGTQRPELDIQDGMLVISSDEELRKRTLTLVYDIRDLLFDVPYFDNAPELEIDAALEQANSVTSGGAGFGAGTGRRSGSNSAIFGDPGADPGRSSRQDQIREIIDLLQTVVDPDGWRDLGGETGSIQELNGNLIITNTPRQHQAIEGLLSQLREIRALQINVEGRFLEVASNWFEQIGVDLDLYFNTNDELFNQLRAVDPQARLSDFFFADGTLKDPVVFGSFDDVQGFDPENPAGPPFNTVPTGNIFGVPNAAGDGIDYNIGPVGTPIRHSEGFSPIPFVQNSLGLVGSLTELTPFASAALANPALAVGISYLDDIQVDLLIRATQADDRSIVLTAPRLTFFNGQRAWVAVTTSTAFVSSVIPVVGDSSGAFQPIVDVLREGFVLDVEGVISADRRYVTMTVIAQLAQNASLERTATFQGAAGGSGDQGGTAATFEGAVTLPEVTVSLVNTTVSVPDKGTILLGGQHFVNEIEVEAGVPVLSKLPFVNRFFTNRVSAREERSLLILIRPEIIIQQEHEDILFPGLSDTTGVGSYLR